MIPCEKDTWDDGKVKGPTQLGLPTDANGKFTDHYLGLCINYPFTKTYTMTQEIRLQTPNANPPGGPCTDPALLSPVVRTNTGL